MFFVLVYILVLVVGKHYFSIYELGIFFTTIGILWLLYSLKSFSLKKILQPGILTLIGLISIKVDSFLVLQSFPLLLSLFFFIAFIHAQVTKKYFLIKNIQRFKTLDADEIIYLEHTHTIWVVVTGVNVLLHIYFLLATSLEVWTFYATVGWYILLGSAILFQILFRKFYEQKNLH